MLPEEPAFEDAGFMESGCTNMGATTFCEGPSTSLLHASAMQASGSHERLGRAEMRRQSREVRRLVVGMGR
jgi:hypothetical protein